MEQSERTCDWGSSTLCGKPATWSSMPDKFPDYLYACDDHAPRMFEPQLAHRLAGAPEMPLEYHKAYVTALAWRSWFTKGLNDLRSLNTRAAFQNEIKAYLQRIGDPHGH